MLNIKSEFDFSFLHLLPFPLPLEREFRFTTDMKITTDSKLKFPPTLQIHTRNSTLEFDTGLL
jgi:hypothetical protein